MDSSSSSASASLPSTAGPAPPPPPPALPAPAAATAGLKRTRRGHVCLQCKEKRKKCDGAMPCSRCFKRGTKCLPQKRQQDEQQPSTVTEGTPVAAAAAAGGGGASAAAATAAAAYYGGLAPLVEALATAASSASLQQTAVVELVFQRASPRPLVELLGQCFMRQALAPGARREVVVDCMRQWYLRCVACGGDASWGLLSRCMQALNVAPSEIEDPRWVASDAALQQRRLDLLQQMSQYAPNGPALLADAWGWENHTETEVGLSVHLPAPDGYGLHLVASNAAFARRIYTMGELHRAFLDKRVLHSVLSALVVAPEDREAYFSSFFQVLFSSTPTRIVQIGKGIDRDGRVGLFLCEARPARINPDGTPAGVATRAEPVPPSRHLTMTPGVPRKQHVEMFRKRAGGQLAPGARAAVAAAAVPPPGVGGGSGGGVGGAATAAAAAAVADSAAVSWLRQLQEQQEQGPALAATVATAAGAAPPMVSAGLMPVPQPAPQGYAHSQGPPPSPLPVAASPAGPSHSPFLLATGGGGAETPMAPGLAVPAPLGYHPLHGPPDLDLEYLEAIFSDAEEERAMEGGDGGK